MGGGANQTTPVAPITQEGTPPKANPFANISFASSSATPAKASFSFGAAASASSPTSKPLFGAPPSAVKPKAPANGFSFGAGPATTTTAPAAPAFSFTNSSQSNNKSTETASKALFSLDSEQSKQSAASTPSVPTFSTPPSSKNGSYNQKMSALNKGLFDWVVAAYETGGIHQCVDWSSAMREYESKVDAIEPTDDEDNDDNTQNNPGGTNKSMSAEVEPSKEEAPKFSFGGSSASAPAPSSESTTSFSFGKNASSSSTAAPPPAGSFSFGFGATALAPAAAAPSFSFGSIPPPSTSASNSTTVDEDDPTANPDDGKIEVEKEKNSDEDILYEVKAKPMKLKKDGSGWQKYGAGKCRLYKHKTTNKHRLVLRNEIGKPLFNVALSSQMTFTKEVKQGKKGKLAYIKFMGVEDASEGPRPMMLQVDPKDVDEFHSKLEGMKE